MCNLKYDANEPTYKTQTDSESRLVIAKVEGGGGRDGAGSWG